MFQVRRCIRHEAVAEVKSIKGATCTGSCPFQSRARSPSTLQRGHWRHLRLSCHEELLLVIITMDGNPWGQRLNYTTAHARGSLAVSPGGLAQPPCNDSTARLRNVGLAPITKNSKHLDPRAHNRIGVFVSCSQEYMQHTMMPQRCLTCPKLSSLSAVTQHSKARFCLIASNSRIQKGVIHVHHKTIAVITNIKTTMMQCLTS